MSDREKCCPEATPSTLFWGSVASSGLQLVELAEADACVGSEAEGVVASTGSQLVGSAGAGCPDAAMACGGMQCVVGGGGLVCGRACVRGRGGGGCLGAVRWAALQCVLVRSARVCFAG